MSERGSNTTGWLTAHPKTAGIIAAVVALAILCLGLEIALRVVIRNESRIDGGLVFDRRLNSRHYMRNFVERYSQKRMWRTEDYDPFLGWDANIAGGRVRGRKLDATFRFDERTAFRVIVIGNSFSFGSQVGDRETYAHYLEQSLSRAGRAECLNMGVGGYGIDQAVLKYLQYGQPYKPNILVMGVFVGNYERAGLSFFSYYKPYHVLDPGTGAIRLVQPAIPAPEEGFALARREVGRYPVYLLPYVWNRLVRIYWQRVDRERGRAYYREMDGIVRGIFQRLQASLRETGTRLVVLQIPEGEAFQNTVGLDRAKHDPNYVHLLGIYRQLGIEYVDLLEEFPRQLPLREVFSDIYLRNPDSGMKGHFSPRGNRIVAELLAGRILEEATATSAGP